MTNTSEFYTKQTIASWDEAAGRHHKINNHLSDLVIDKKFNNLNTDFNCLVDSIDVKNKSVVQLCCNNAIDLLSLKKKGAGRCVGIDGSQSFIDQAKALSKAAHCSDMEFVCANIYEASKVTSEKFDIVLLTVGVIYWMPDLPRFMQICADFLKEGGLLLMEEIHPILNMYDEGSPSYLASSYFDRTPYEDNLGLDYFTNKKYISKPNYWFSHTLSDLFMAAINAGLTLRSFKELDYNVGNYCEDLASKTENPPMAINLLWQR